MTNFLRKILQGLKNSKSEKIDDESISRVCPSCGEETERFDRCESCGVDYFYSNGILYFDCGDEEDEYVIL